MFPSQFNQTSIRCNNKNKDQSNANDMWHPLQGAVLFTAAIVLTAPLRHATQYDPLPQKLAIVYITLRFEFDCYL